MPRRRREPPPADRLAAILGMPRAAPPEVAPPLLAGWVPQRTSVARTPAAVPDELGPAVVPHEVTPTGVPHEVVPDEVTPTAIPDETVPHEVDLAAVPSAVPVQFVDARPAAGRHRRPGPPKPAILTVPLALRGVRARPRRLAVLGVLLLVVATGAVLGIRVAWARSAAEPESISAAAHGPPSGLVARTVPAAFASTGATGSPTAPATASGVLLVHVVGQVRRPGVVRLPPGSRALDAVKAAGGASSAADLNHLNLARAVTDGEQIVVPKPGEVIPAAGSPGTAGAGTAGTGGALAGPGSSAGGSAGGLVNLNTADAAALESLPGVGPVLTQRILDWRTANGRFSSVDELGEVSGIGDKMLAQIGPKVTV